MGRANGHLPCDAEGDAVSLEQELLEALRSASSNRTESAANLAMDLCRIPAPTGDESERAHFVADLLKGRGYEPEVDDLSNVYALRGDATRPSVMLLAHTDTVFPRTTPLDVTRTGNELHGPGIGDNCLGVAAMLSAIDVLDDLGISTQAPLRIVANVGEEGLGNLRGAWRAVESYRDSTSVVVAIEGHNLGRITNVAVGSKRWRVTVRGPGGHSWGAFGEPSAIHGLGRIIAGIAEIRVPSEPRTSFNVGMIEGGTSINTIAPVASAMIDMRSVDEHALDVLAAEVKAIVDSRAGDGLSVDVEVLGERPAGSTSVDHPAIEAAVRTLHWLGFDPLFDASSTDANVPISLGIPAFCVGMSSGDRVHTIDESIQVEPIAFGLAQLARLCIDLTDLVAKQAN